MKNRLRNAFGQRAGKTARLLNRAGFTLLELLVVVGILAALVALALPFYQDYVNQSKTTAAASDLATFRKALAAYDQLEPEVYKNPPNIDMRGLIGKYLQDYRTSPTQTGNPKDPWGNEYSLDTLRGVIWTSGSNLVNESSSLLDQSFGNDDIGVSYKPEFFITSVQVLSSTRIRVNFSRRLDKSVVLTAANFTVTNPATSGNACSYESNTSVVVTLAAALNTGAHTLTYGGVALRAADLRPLASTNKNELGLNGHTRDFSS